MPKNKSHHYVPQFYLRNFSNDEKRINLFNIKRESVILDAGIKQQCCRDYFYGKTLDLEENMCRLEGIAGSAIKHIRTSSTIPADNLSLRIYLLAQHYRTLYSSEEQNELVDKFTKHLIHHEKGNLNLSPEEIDGVKVQLTEPGRFVLQNTLTLYPLILDLEFAIVNNPTEIKFITSDNPCIFYNHFMNFRKYFSNTGLVSKGLQILLPISPEQYLMLYDPYAYRTTRTNIVEASEADVKNLNCMQIISAHENLYFRDKFPHAQFYNFKKHRIETKASVDVVNKKHELGKIKELVKLSGSEIRVDLPLSFMHITKQSLKWRRDYLKQSKKQAAIIRNPMLLRDFEEFEGQKKQGYNGSFLDFVRKMT